MRLHFSAPLLNSGILLSNEFNQVTAVILVNFDSTFVLGVVALQLVDFGQCVIVIQISNYLVEKWTHIDG